MPVLEKSRLLSASRFLQYTLITPVTVSLFPAGPYLYKAKYDVPFGRRCMCSHYRAPSQVQRGARENSFSRPEGPFFSLWESGGNIFSEGERDAQVYNQNYGLLGPEKAYKPTFTPPPPSHHPASLYYSEVLQLKGGLNPLDGMCEKRVERKYVGRREGFSVLCG